MIEELNYIFIDKNANTWSKRKFSREDAEIFSNYLIENDCYMCDDCTYCENCIGCINCDGCKNCDRCENCKDCSGLKYRTFAINENEEMQ